LAKTVHHMKHSPTPSILPVLGAAVIALGAAFAQAANGWTLVWADEFAQADGSAPDPAKWVYDLGGGGWGNNELETYTNRRTNSWIEGGKLIIAARSETFTGSDNIQRNYTSARLKTQGKAAWTLGRMEARIKLPRGQGIWPAFWMLGTNITSAGWPTCGEIDILENIGREPYIVHGTVHGPDYSGGNAIGGGLTNAVPVADDFHLYAIEWEAARIRWFMDNRLYFTVTPANLPGGAQWVFDHPHFFILNVAVGGAWPGNPNGSTVFPQKMEVDYVRVYAATNAAMPALQIRKTPAQVEVVWPGEFPNARLSTTLGLGQPWQEIVHTGTRQQGMFVHPAAPGFYRLALHP
jgi:beta-glucanase (GH16 family)